jgi:hypothetical protein
MEVKSGRCHAVSVIISLIFHFSFLIVTILPSHAQYNVERLVNVGRSALYYEDYVLSMQYFNQAIAAKPYLYEPWFSVVWPSSTSTTSPGRRPTVRRR